MLPVRFKICFGDGAGGIILGTDKICFERKDGGVSGRIVDLDTGRLFIKGCVITPAITVNQAQIEIKSHLAMAAASGKAAAELAIFSPLCPDFPLRLCRWFFGNNVNNPANGITAV